MPFQKGHKLSPGGKKGGKGGRPSKTKAEIKKEASVIAREFIDKHVRPFLDSYLALGTGKVIEKFDKDGNVVRLVMIDPATVRHAIDKFVPPIEKVEHSGEIGVKEWVVDAYEPKKKGKP